MKKTKYSLYVCVILTVAFFCTSSIAFLNYKVDYYSVFSEHPSIYTDDASVPVSHPNYSFLRVRHFLSNHKYDSIFFASSRAMSWDLKKHFGNNWYRLAFNQGDVTEDYLHALKLSVKKKNIKEVFLLLDNFNFSQSSYDLGKSGLNRLFYPSSISEKFKFYMSYLFAYPDKSFFNVLRGKYKKILMPEEDRHPSVAGAVFDAGRKEPYSFLDSSEHLSAMSKIKANIFTDYHIRLNQGLSEIKELVDICIENNIKLTIAVNPFYYKNFINFNLFYMEYWKRKLAKIHSFYDFSGVNLYTVDNRYWYEYSHYTKFVADRIVSVIKNNNFEKFGAFVTLDNIDEHNMAVREQANSFLSENKDVAFSHSFSNKFRTLLQKSSNVLEHGSRDKLLRNSFYDFFNIKKFFFDIVNGSLKFEVCGPNAFMKWDTRYAPEDADFEFLCTIVAPVDTLLSIKSNGNTYQYRLKRGLNEVRIPLVSAKLSDFVQLYPGNDSGVYEIKKMEINVLSS